MDDIKTLEHKSEIADARLDVAEGFGWAVAGLSAVIAGMALHWIVGGLALFPIYFTITKPFRTEASKAEDAHHFAARMGNHSPALTKTEG